MNEGIIELTNKQYHSSNGISSSGIKELLKSPAHYKQYLSQRTEPTPEMIRGTLVHSLILEPDKFTQDFHVGEFAVRRGKEYERLLASCGDKTLVSVEQVKEASEIALQVERQAHENPVLAAYLKGQKEKSFFWIDPATKVECKVRPDNISNNGGSLTDLKTTRDAGPDFFLKQVIDFGYFISAAFYLRGIHHVLSNHGYLPGITELPTEFVFIAIETKAPYQVAIYKADEKMLLAGNFLVDKALDRLSECISTDTWEGYSKEVKELSLPPWALSKYGVGR